MAFVHSLPYSRTHRTRVIQTCTRNSPSMSASQLSRRAALQSLAGVAAAGLFGVGAANAAGGVSLEDLRSITSTKKQKTAKGKKADVLDDLDYSSELFETPGDVETNDMLREKKPKKENEAIASETAREKKEEEEYDAMLTNEAAESARVRASFKKTAK